MDESLKGAKDVSALEKEYQNAETRVKDFERQKNSLLESIGACKKDITNYENALVSFGKANQKNAKVSLNIEYTQAVFDWVSEAYKTRESSVRSKLEERVNSNFSLMYHGSRTISIDEKYRVKYIDVTTEESDGLKAVKSFAFVSGLVDLAKEALSSDKSKEADGNYIVLVFKNRGDKESLIGNMVEGLAFEDNRFCNGHEFLEKMYEAFEEQME